LVYDEFKEMLLCDEYSFILEDINEIKLEDIERNDVMLNQ